MDNGSGSPPVSTSGAGRDMGDNGIGTGTPVSKVPTVAKIAVADGSSHMPNAPADQNGQALP